MHYDFDKPVDRRGTGDMKGSFAPRTECGRTPLVLAGAEMDFPTAPVIVQALSAFACRGLYGFTLADDAYLGAIVHWMSNVRRMHVSEKDIVPTLGTIFALSTAIRAFSRPGEGIIALHPSYYRQDRAVVRNGRHVVSVPMRCGAGRYSVDFSMLAEAMARPENRILILCNPHNPTGRVFSREELKSIASLARETGTLVFSDEIFAEHTLPGVEMISMAEMLPERSLTCTSLGKAFNFTGVNHANVIIRDERLRSDYMVQRNIDHFGSIDPFFYQAVIAAYTPAGREWIDAVRVHAAENAVLLKKLLPELSMSPAEGCYIAWLDVSGAGMDGDAFADAMEKEQAVLVDRGSEYGPGGENHIRVNLATPQANIREFAARVHALLAGRKIQ
jgi:cystathionine beta-lyase